MRGFDLEVEIEASHIAIFSAVSLTISIPTGPRSSTWRDTNSECLSTSKSESLISTSSRQEPRKERCNSTIPSPTWILSVTRPVGPCCGTESFLMESWGRRSSRWERFSEAEETSEVRVCRLEVRYTLM